MEFVLAALKIFWTKNKIFVMGKHSSLYRKSGTGLTKFYNINQNNWLGFTSSCVAKTLI